MKSFINEGSDEYVETTEEWCRRTIYLETERIQYPVVKEKYQLIVNQSLTIYESFIETYKKKHFKNMEQ